MSVFGKSKRHYTKKAPKTLDSILSNSMNRVLTKNPGLAEKVAAKKFGYEEFLTEPDETEKVKKDMQTLIFKQALREIEINPELSKRLAERKAEEILGITPEGEQELDGYPGSSSVSQLMEDMEQYEELRKRFGGGGGGVLGGLVDKDTINSILKLLTAMQQGKSGVVKQVVQERQVLVATPDGTLAEVAESKYLELYKAGQIRPIAALAAPKQEAQTPVSTSIAVETAQTTEAPVPVQTGPNVDDLLGIVNLQEIEEFLAYTPEEFIERLNDEMVEGVTRASLLKTLLKTVDYSQIVQYITPYREHEQLGRHVKSLLSPEGKIWAERVLELVKSEIQG